MRSVGSLAPIVLALATAACSASLRDGAYACSSDTPGQCPSGWHCWSDGTCHVRTEPPDAGIDAFVPMMPDVGPPRDSGASPTFGGACTGAAECTPPEICTGPDPAHHACLHDCSAAACPRADEMCVPESFCIVTPCSPTGSQGSCPSHFVCRSDLMGNPSCFPSSWP